MLNNENILKKETKLKLNYWTHFGRESRLNRWKSDIIIIIIMKELFFYFILFLFIYYFIKKTTLNGKTRWDVSLF